ncbi:MAG: hypothetical protein JRH20_31365 [Deltaproteobacteria bacterium]|nr:hypothetical protein [Deltaproteobacteria bacterium]
MGAGGALDDFPHSPFLGELIVDYTRGKWADNPIDLVFNGDCFDFLKTGVNDAWPYHINKEIALRKLDSVLGAHSAFLEAIDTFVHRGGGRNTVHFVTGNHDAELLFPAVQRALRNACGGHELVRFPGFELNIGPVHFEHGHQFDPLFRMDPAHTFVSRDAEPLLNLSWAAIGLLSIVMPMHPILYFYDRVLPRSLLFELFPDLRELFTALAWRYWTKDFWRGFLIEKDPLLRFEWTMAKEVIKRIAFRNTEVIIDNQNLADDLARGDYQLHITGHLHEIGYRQVGAQRVIQSGAMRDEYFIGAGGTSFKPTLKGFVEVLIDGTDVVGLNTRELHGPVRPADHMLETILDLAPFVQEQLELLGDTTRQVAASQKQERIEAAESRKK